MELRCRRPFALAGTDHVHRHARGGTYIEGEGWRGVANTTGRYTPEMGTLYAKEVSRYCSNVERREYGGPSPGFPGFPSSGGHTPKQFRRPYTELKDFAGRSQVPNNSACPVEVRRHPEVKVTARAPAKQFLLMPNDRCISLGSHYQ